MKGYHDKYLANSKKVFLVGIVWDPETRAIDQYEVKRVTKSSCS